MFSTMEEAPNYVLYEHSIGYSLFKIKEFEDVGLLLPEVKQSFNDAQRFQSIVQIHAFEPFKNIEAALSNMKDVSEGLVNDDLLNFLESNLPKKRKKFLMGLADGKLATSIFEKTDIRCTYTGVVLEVIRGIRTHFGQLMKDLPHHSLIKAQLGLAHSYSRAKVKFDVHRVDNMIIQSIAILDQLDKDINLFGMRIREWYAYHFPELFIIVPDLYSYVRCACVIKNRENIDEEVVERLNEILAGTPEKVDQLVEAARMSMGMEISDLDLANIDRFAHRVVALVEYRAHLHEYLKDRMDSCAPSLNALIGEQVGARLIAHSGSLTNLAKCPASTVQILGAEKALFRSIKTRTNTPKYGLIFNSNFIGRAIGKNKGRISRFVANKISIASRIDCFSDVPVSTFGEHLRELVEGRLQYFETGKKQSKNCDVMKEAMDEAVVTQKKAAKKLRKAAKREQKLQVTANGDADVEMTEVAE